MLLNKTNVSSSSSTDMDTTQEVPDLGSLVSSDGEDVEMSVGLDVDEMLQDVAAMQREIEDLGDDLSGTW